MKTKIDRNTLRERFVPDARMECKALDSVTPNGPGEFNGYLAVFGNVDQLGEIIQPGAFKRTLGLKLGEGKTLPLMRVHFANGGRTKDVIGSIDSAIEDDFGLKIHSVFSSDASSQETRIKVYEKHVKGLSVGYKTIRYSVREAETDEEREILNRCGRESIVILEELELDEGTVTPCPVNLLAEITDAKSMPDTCPHCHKSLNAPQNTATEKAPAPDDTAKSAPVVTAPAAKSAPVLTALHRRAARQRELDLLLA